MNKTVLITGGSRGIGKFTAIYLASKGYNVAFTYNNSSEKANQVLEEITSNGGNAFIIKCDISKEEQVKNMVNQVLTKYGKIDVLINNAAVCFDSLFSEKTTDDFKKTLEVNVLGTFLVSKYVGENMMNNKYGKIVNISSTNGINTYYPMCIDYDASKSAIISLTHNLAMQFAPFVNVNCIAPGFIATESEIGGMDEDFIKLEEEKIFLKRAGTEQDIANLIEFLISDKASYINSSIIRIDGGMYGE